MEFVTDSRSVKGRFHDVNEDSFICNDNFIVIADGMGGEANGEVASNIAIKTISSVLNENIELKYSEKDYKDIAFFAISEADKEISNYVLSHPEADGMGTTVLLLIRNGRNLYIAWCGDSHCYRYQPHKSLCSLTIDHSYVQQLIDENKITIEESYTHPDNNLVTRYVGGGKDTCRPDFITSYLEDDTVVILCSDGLSGYCRSEDIKSEIDSSNLKDLPERLIELAVRHGSEDDITIVTLSSKCKSIHASGLIMGWLKRLFHSKDFRDNI